MFTDLDEAKREAKLAARKIQKGLQATNDLRPAERESYLVAQRRLNHLDVPLICAVDEYAKCRERLGDVPLLAAVEEYLRRANGVTMGVSVPQVVEELIAAKEQDGISDRYRLQLQSTLGQFKEAFPGPIMHVKSDQIDRWLRKSKLAPVTRNNRLTVLRVLFNFAKQRKLPAEVGDLGGRVRIQGEARCHRDRDLRAGGVWEASPRCPTSACPASGNRRICRTPGCRAIPSRLEGGKLEAPHDRTPGRAGQDRLSTHCSDQRQSRCLVETCGS